MPNPILSLWTEGSCSTNYASVQTVQQWIDNHIGRAKSNIASNEPDSGDPIITRWYSGGVQYEVSTDKEPAETTKHWIDRHFDRVRDKMATNPPDTI